MKKTIKLVILALLVIACILRIKANEINEESSNNWEALKLAKAIFSSDLKYDLKHDDIYYSFTDDDKNNDDDLENNDRLLNKIEKDVITSYSSDNDDNY